MGWKDEGIVFKNALDQQLSGLDGGLQIVAAGKVRLRPGHLNGMMESVSCEVRLHTTGDEP